MELLGPELEQAEELELQPEFLAQNPELELDYLDRIEEWRLLAVSQSLAVPSVAQVVVKMVLGPMGLRSRCRHRHPKDWLQQELELALELVQEQVRAQDLPKGWQERALALEPVPVLVREPELVEVALRL